jgi:hypothetical protein
VANQHKTQTCVTLDADARERLKAISESLGNIGLSAAVRISALREYQRLVERGEIGEIRAA